MVTSFNKHKVDFNSKGQNFPELLNNYAATRPAEFAYYSLVHMKAQVEKSFKVMNKTLLTQG